MRSDISSIDISAYERYAHDVTAITSFIEKYAPLLGDRASIQTAIINVVPKFSATTYLFQDQQKIRFARIMLPISYLMWHTFSSYAVPSLGANEVIDPSIQKIRDYVRQTSTQLSPEEKAALEDESETLIRALEEIKGNNKMVDSVRAMIQQFLPV